MHQDTAHFAMPAAFGLVAAAMHDPGEAERIRLVPVKRELGRVVKNQNRSLLRGHALAGRFEMALQNIFFAHALVREKPVRGFRVRPILTGQRNAIAHGSLGLFNEHAKSRCKPGILEPTSRKLSIEPRVLAPASTSAIGNAPSQRL